MERVNELKEKIVSLLKEAGKPLKKEQLTELSGAGGLERELEELISAGKLMLTQKGKYALPEQMGLRSGKFRGNARGFGFFLPEDQSGDMFVPLGAQKGAMNGDDVWVRPLAEQTGQSRECEVVIIAKRNTQRVVGTFEAGGRGGGYVIPDDMRQPEHVYINGNTKGARTGDKVVAEITAYPAGKRPMLGKISEILGAEGDKGVDILSVARQYGLEDRFSKGARNMAAGISQEIRESDIKGREDLCGLLTVTIDGADAKDLDDAISLVMPENGCYRLGVHIADVSSYVKQDSPIDIDAYKRGTSVYLLDRVIPMLPKELSNGACSLNPDQAKLTLSCIMDFNGSGKCVGSRLTESVIRSSKRMTYEDVNAMFEGDEALINANSDVFPMLEKMMELSDLLTGLREKRGSIDFDLYESKITLDETGRAIDVQKAERGRANRMIEEFMLKANETVASQMSLMELPLMYRVHERPEKDKLSELQDFVRSLGYTLRNTNDIRPGDIQELLRAVKGQKEEALINKVTLRSMKKAIYKETCDGHFGLASQKYCHFTSPIRRYPDLVVHRLVKEMLRGGLTAQRQEEWNKKLPEMAKQCSERERTAMEAERAVDDLKKCEYMQGKIGETMRGLVSGVTSFGFFVELDNTVEGLVRLGTLRSDYFTLDAKNHRLIGRNANNTFKLGDPVIIRVTGADIESRSVDFELIEKLEEN